jgi:lipoprotein-releasing system permease protein
MVDYDSSLDLERYVTGVALNVAEPFDIDAYGEKVKSMKGLAPHTWKNTNSALLFALKLEKFTMGSILMLIVLVAAFSISGTMMMTVFHRKNQVCLMRSLGMTQGDVARLFMIQGMVIGFIGIVIGLAIGLGVCGLLWQFRFVNMPPSIGYLRALPVKFLPLDYVVICVSAWLLSLAGATYPALTAARQNPSSGLRY